MKPDEYNDLEIVKRARLIQEYGIPVHSRITSKSIVTIFGVGNFYVEVYRGKDKHIKEIKGIAKPSDWDGYLKSINLKELGL